MRDVLAASEKEKKGVMVYFRGGNIAGVVTKSEGEFVELRSREYGRIVVKFESIDCVAMS